jgi:hypothetical protein
MKTIPDITRDTYDSYIDPATGLIRLDDKDDREYRQCLYSHLLNMSSDLQIIKEMYNDIGRAKPPDHALKRAKKEGIDKLEWQRRVLNSVVKIETPKPQTEIEAFREKKESLHDKNQVPIYGAFLKK